MIKSGYTGRALLIDLSALSYKVLTHDEQFETEVLSAFIGGRGLGVKLISQYILEQGITNSENIPLILATGPLTGTIAPTSGRMSFVSLSPLTGTVFDSSVGGNLGVSIKKAGYDYISIIGKADRPYIIKITGSSVEFIKTRKLNKTSEFFQRLEKGYSGACVGEAGWNGCLYASIIVDQHFAAARGGLGYIMAAKNLCGIMVAGNEKIRIHDESLLEKAREDIMRLMRSSPAIFGEFGLSEFGTVALIDLIATRRMMPTDNFRSSYHPEYRNFSAYYFKERFDPKKNACSGCPIACKKIAKTGEPVPEYESTSHFGALLNMTEPEQIIVANSMCNDLGLDTISTASTIACYREIQNKNLSSKQIFSLITDIAYGKGEGAALMLGSKRYADELGKTDASMSVKSLELPAYDPRGAYGMALAYATSNRGGCHLRAYPIAFEILRKPISLDRFTFSGKSRVIKICEDNNAVVDSLTACKFAFFGASIEEYSKAYQAVTGIEKQAQDLLNDGERIINLERRINNHLGFNRSHDNLPARFFKEPGSSGNNIRIDPLSEEDFQNALSTYYDCRNWDQNGVSAD